VSQGYSLRLRDLNRRASGKLLGVQLGRVCIKHDVPASVVAGQMGVSRQTVYNWFRGTSNPSPNLTGRIERYIASLS
jgi:transcriptional regulator with XRE-family HTH domain